MESISFINFAAKKDDPLLNFPYDVQLRCLSANVSNMSKKFFRTYVSYSVSFISKLFTLSTASATTVSSPCRDLLRIFRCVNMSTGIYEYCTFHDMLFTLAGKTKNKALGHFLFQENESETKKEFLYEL